MNAQAEQMKAIVKHLMTLVGGVGNGNTASTKPKVGKIKEALHLTRKKFDRGKTEPQGFKTPINPEKVIPLEQEDFRDF
jgi:hypothetical protein